MEVRHANGGKGAEKSLPAWVRNVEGVYYWIIGTPVLLPLHRLFGIKHENGFIPQPVVFNHGQSCNFAEAYAFRR